MIINIDVHTKDANAAANLFVAAFNGEAQNIRMNTSEDWDTKINIMFTTDHKNTELLDLLDSPHFTTNASNL